jgi:epoxyqueuosine reductase
MDLSKIKQQLRLSADDRGARLFGACRIDDLRETFNAEIRDISKKLNTAVSVGVPLSSSVMDTIVDRPNILYKTHYQQVNHTLNDIAFIISSEIERLGGEAIPIPASKITDWEKFRAHLSHREIAYQAGLGWWGRNNLLVNEKYGSQVRLVTILTNLELEADRPVETDCGECYACLDVCPVGAIGKNREDFNLAACHEKIKEFSRYRGYGHLICGICLRHCSGRR